MRFRLSFSHGSRSTAAVTASSLAGVRTFRGRTVFTNTVRVTLLSQGDAATVVETRKRLDDVN